MTKTLWSGMALSLIVGVILHVPVFGSMMAATMAIFAYTVRHDAEV